MPNSKTLTRQGTCAFNRVGSLPNNGNMMRYAWSCYSIEFDKFYKYLDGTKEFKQSVSAVCDKVIADYSLDLSDEQRATLISDTIDYIENSITAYSRSLTALRARNGYNKKDSHGFTYHYLTNLYNDNINATIPDNIFTDEVIDPFENHKLSATWASTGRTNSDMIAPLLQGRVRLTASMMSLLRTS
jgi:hypothetical protein